ncbi:MAG: hypothetical protein JWO31_3908, partial [Phycisphaerales bacterium]|nr:hypothetical protein [Phycisphaerales bacterium]
MNSSPVAPRPEPDRDQVRELFFEAVETPLSTRLAWLARRCGDLPPAARAELDGLLSAHDEAAGFLAAPSIDIAGPSGPGGSLASNASPSSDNDAPPELPDPAAVGPYRVVRRLGSGGFGTVYLADQDKPVRRRVAVKVINPGMDTRRVIARFGVERRALALMDHPNIARVLDAGATDAGRPYFVMEWVDGPPITDYCRDHGLSVRDRLGLFAAACRAVHHAHGKGVIHRDLKPGNVLVAEHDGRLVPKVIDFGVAKALGGTAITGVADSSSGEAGWSVGAPLTAAAADGRPGVVGTPQYMSPEQASCGGGGSDDGPAVVNERADVYGLGALLYELLAGVPPFDPARLRAAGPVGLARVLREEEPPPPSRRAPRLRRELDWVVGRAMAKDPARRYPSAAELAADVGRYLADEPVTARPPTRRYRLRAFARRRRGPLLAAAVVLGTAGIGGAATAVGLARAHD